MKILVTGGAGFVGANLCAYLLRQNNQVICIDNFSTGRKSNLAGISANKNFELLEHDITEPLDPNCMGEIDQIYNLACPASPPKYQKDPVFTWKTSVIGSLNMLELARIKDAVILHASTSEIYGDPEIHPQPENYWGNVNPVGIRACYDEGKRAAESLFFDYQRKFATKIRIARIFNTYGPLMDPGDGRVVSNFIMQALNNKNLTIYGDGSQTRSFQYIDDLVAGLAELMNNNSDFSGPVNLGNPHELTVLELAKKTLTLIPECKSKIIYNPLPQDDPKKRQPDISLAKQKLGWEPKIKLEEGLKETIRYFRKIA